MSGQVHRLVEFVMGPLCGAVYAQKRPVPIITVPMHDHLGCTQHTYTATGERSRNGHALFVHTGISRPLPAPLEDW